MPSSLKKNKLHPKAVLGQAQVYTGDGPSASGETRPGAPYV